MWKFILNQYEANTSAAAMKDKEKEHSKDDSGDDPIPLDLKVEILTRLPVKDILKFQFVSKTWFSIIRSKDFINSLVSTSTSPSSRLIISLKNGRLTNKNSEKCLFFFTSSQQGEDHEEASSSLVANLDMTMTSMDSYYYTRCASLNGFIALSHQGRFMICNPSTRQVITLPEIKGTKWKSTYKYLGYDPVDDQYKALCKRVSYFKEDQEHVVLTINGGGKKCSWRRIKGTTLNYYPLTKGVCINGFVYYGASTQPSMYIEVIVCFDVRSERLSFIKSPSGTGISTLIDYKGNLAIIGDDRRSNFDLWVLEDVKKHQWSMRSILRSWWDSFGEIPMYCSGVNKAGELIIAPEFLPRKLGPFYIFYYNVETHKIRKVLIEGVADSEDFRRRYGIGNNGDCHVYISQEYGENFTFL